MHAPPKPTDIPVLEDPAVLEPYDGFLLGIPTRYGNFPAQWKAFWDRAGKQWATGGFYGKMAGVFVSSAGFGGGQESTAIAAMSTLAHQGIIYVPLGYAKAFPLMADLSEVRGGGPWGAVSYSSPRAGIRDAHVGIGNADRLTGHFCGLGWIAPAYRQGKGVGSNSGTGFLRNGGEVRRQRLTI